MAKIHVISLRIDESELKELKDLAWSMTQMGRAGNPRAKRVTISDLLRTLYRDRLYAWRQTKGVKDRDYDTRTEDDDDDLDDIREGDPL